ncbi:hypothetical protein M8J77_015954 [Diaphorina citri]|nr:hypothetical protein M8J77_015954 [Diaphorina citri]
MSMERTMSRHGSVTPSVRSEDSQTSHLAQDLSLSELKAFVEKKAKENYYLTIQNEIFEKYLLRRDSAILKDAEQEQKLSKQRFEQEKTKARMSVPSSCHSTSSFYSPKKKITIPLRIRNEILVRDLEDMLVKHEKSLEQHERHMIRLRCVGEELTGRCHLVENVLCKLKNAGRYETFGEVKKFVENTIRQSAERIERIRLKMKTMKSTLTSVQNELTRKIDPGNAVKGIDFEIAQIENTKLNKALKETCEELLRLKEKEDELNMDYKRKEDQLKTLLLLFTQLIQDVNSTNRSIGLLQQNQRKIEDENMFLDKKIQVLQTVASVTQTPSILEHMALSRQIGLRAKEHTSLIRQMALAQQNYQNHKSKANHMCR